MEIQSQSSRPTALRGSLVGRSERDKTSHESFDGRQHLVLRATRRPASASCRRQPNFMNRPSLLIGALINPNSNH